MLRRKLLVLLGSLVALWAIAAVVAILLLHNVLKQLDHVSTAALSASAATTELVATINSVETGLNAHRNGDIDQRRQLQSAVDALNAQVVRLGEADVMPEEGQDTYRRIRNLLPVFTQRLEAILDPNGSPQAHASIAPVSVELREQIAELSRIAHEHTEIEQQHVTTTFRWTAVGLGITFLLLINISILLLIRSATMILQPVDRLVDASRRLAREEFDHRVELDRADEFGELAAAYNNLASELSANEQRKMETLHQVARTLNHELNNAIAIVDLQLEMLSRSAHDDPVQEERLRQIHTSLHRISRTADAISRVRRIVLTEYVSGQKMLDLERSVEEEPTAQAAPTPPRATVKSVTS